MVEVTVKDWDTTVPNFQNTQDAEKLFLKSSWVINFHCRKLSVSNILNLNHASLIVGDATDKNTIVYFTTGVSGRNNATGISRISSSIINPPVLKFADADPGNGNGAHQHGADNQNNANGNGAAYPNAPVYNMFANGGDHGGGIGNGNGGDHNNGIGNGYGVDPVGIRIHRVELYNGGVVLKPVICTNITANDYNSWHGFSEAIYKYWLRFNGDKNEGNIDVEDISPINCWPGSVTGFGRWDGQVWHVYHWFEYSWDTVQMLITDVLLYKAMYGEEPFLREMPYENGNVVIDEGNVDNTLQFMHWLLPFQDDDGDDYDEIDGNNDGNGNGDDADDGGNSNGVDDAVSRTGNGDDGGTGNGVDGDDHGGNGNGVDGDDGGSGNRVDSDHHGENGSEDDIDDGRNGDGVDGDDGGNGSENGGNCSKGCLGLLICSMVLSFTFALVILAKRNT